jgi:hypothetical protein
MFPGVPIFNGHGTAEAAIVISGVLKGGKPPIHELTKQLLEATQSISEKLGYVPENKSINPQEGKNQFSRLEFKLNQGTKMSAAKGAALETKKWQVPKTKVGVYRQNFRNQRNLNERGVSV